MVRKTVELKGDCSGGHCCYCLVQGFDGFKYVVL